MQRIKHVWANWIKRICRRQVEKLRYNHAPSAIRRRTRCYGKLFGGMGEKCYILAGCIIDAPEHITLGNGVSIRHNCYLSGKGGITIGNDVSLGNGTKIFTTEHPFDNSGRPFKYHPLEMLPVTIGNNVVIGADVILLGGVHVGDNVMIGAGAVVTKDIPSNSVYAGNPAKRIENI